MELGHFILVIVKLDCLVANDGNVCCASPATVICQSVSLKCISLSGILHYERGRWKKRGREKPYNSINFFPFFLSQVIVTLRSHWQAAATAKAGRMTLTGSRSSPERSPPRIPGCPQVRQGTPSVGRTHHCYVVWPFSHPRQIIERGAPRKQKPAAQKRSNALFSEKGMAKPKAFRPLRGGKIY